MSNEEINKKAKARAWTAIVYPESAPENWQDILKETCLEGLISPLHDKDVEDEGELKKPHWHVMMVWPGPTTYSNAKTILDKVNGVLDPTPVQHIGGMARYFLHLDSPHKHQYSRTEIIELGGLDYEDTIAKTQNQTKVLKEIFKFIDEHCILSFDQLLMYTIKYDLTDWFKVLTERNTLAITNAMKSKAWGLKAENRELIDTYTSRDFLNKLYSEDDEEEGED